MDVSRDGSLMVVGQYGAPNEGTVGVFSLPGLELVRRLGLAARLFSTPWRLCLVPANNNVIVADFGNLRVREVTIEGADVGLYGTAAVYSNGAYPCSVCVSFDSRCVGVGTYNAEMGRPKVTVFLHSTREVLLQCGVAAPAPVPAGLLGSHCDGVAFSPSGKHITVTEYYEKRVSVFDTASGAFVSCVGVGVLGEGHKDVRYLSRNELAVTNNMAGKVCVFAAGTGELLREWGSSARLGLVTGLSLAVARLYVIDNNSTRIHVFT